MKKKMKNIRMTAKISPVIIILYLTAFACSFPEEDNTPLQQPVTVDVNQADFRDISSSYSFAGRVASERTVNLATKVTGRVTQLNMEEGDYAAEGEVLVRIEDENLNAQKAQVEANLEQARASLENIEKNYNRLTTLFEKGSATQKELDDITTRYEVAKAKVRALEGKMAEIEELLDYTVLRAPFDGYVVKKMISEGDLANPGRPLISFEQTAERKVWATVPESQVSLFEVDDTVTVAVEAAGLHSIEGIVTAVNPSGNRGSRQFMVEVGLPSFKTESGIKPGMFARVSLDSQRSRVITLPKSALVKRGQLTGVYTLNEDSEIVLRWIRIGTEREQEVEVLSGLAKGETYVVSSPTRLREGQKVNVQ